MLKIIAKMLNFFVTHGMVVDKNHEIVSFRQCKWLKNNLYFNTQKRKLAENDFEKNFY